MNVPDYGISVRSQVIGVIEGGLAQKEVALRLVVGELSVQGWWYNHRIGTSMETKPRSGRPKNLSRVPKLIITNQWANNGNLQEGSLEDSRIRVILYQNPLYIGI